VKPDNVTELSETVTVYSRHEASGALLLRHPQLDADGRTLTVVGPKSLLPGRVRGEQVVVRLPNGGLVVGRITHIHTTHDSYRVAISTADVMRVGAAMPRNSQPTAPLARNHPAQGLRWASRSVSTGRRA
jgi:hypothetical protein